MKKVLLSLFSFFLSANAFTQTGDITVTIVSSEPGTGITIIDYNFTGVEDYSYNLTVEVKFDDDDYMPVSEDHLSGDFSKVSGNGTSFTGTIFWDGAASYPDRYHEEARIRIMATLIWFKDITTENIEVTNPITGKTWMDRNLGAGRVALNSTDNDAFGDIFQWGREADGHEKRYSNKTSTQSISDNPGHSNFIATNAFHYETNPYDWRITRNTNLWQGVNGINNPCPEGFRLPTIAEWLAERDTWLSHDDAGAFASILKLPLAGIREPFNGNLQDEGEYSAYWSSTIKDDVNSHFFTFFQGDTYEGRAYGFSVRCIKD